MKTVKTVFHFTLNTVLWKCIIHCICFTGEIWSLCITTFKGYTPNLIKCESKSIYIFFIYKCCFLNIHSINIWLIISASLWTTWNSSDHSLRPVDVDHFHAIQFSALVSCCSRSVISVSTAMSLGSTIDVFATEDPNITEAAEQELQIYEKKSTVTPPGSVKPI